MKTGVWGDPGRRKTSTYEDSMGERWAGWVDTGTPHDAWLENMDGVSSFVRTNQSNMAIPNNLGLKGRNAFMSVHLSPSLECDGTTSLIKHDVISEGKLGFLAYE